MSGTAEAADAFSDGAFGYDTFKVRCADAAYRLAPLAGHFVTRIALDSLGGQDMLEVAVGDGAGTLEATVRLGGLRHLAISKPAEIQDCFVERIALHHLPKAPEPWPAGTAGFARRLYGLDELAWLRIEGPAEVEAVAAEVTVRIPGSPAGD
ncbi:hypothetical protein [Actinacidiphila guanduensis]|uniref:Uncharacterized protein n=1 Tax=Actinacidiphila guanduensis TaxID=310781 RepID=A0A1H0MML0_9ACTN|nr:hypothetical protein [Actinacidiphila guanduensis]SDO81642.1 hypothetical protein SAMN05216259_11321 [Actinacidiphila guanduensis]